MVTALADTLHGDHPQARRSLTQLLRLLVDLRLIPTPRGREVGELEQHEAGRLPVPLEDEHLAAPDEETTAASRDRGGRGRLVPFVALGVIDIGLDDDVGRHARTLRCRVQTGPGPHRCAWPGEAPPLRRDASSQLDADASPDAMPRLFRRSRLLGMLACRAMIGYPQSPA